MKPPTLRLLISSLLDLASEAVRNYPFPDPSGKWQEARVFLHDLPDIQEADTWPFVVVRWQEGSIESEIGMGASLSETVNLYCGVYAPRSPAEAGLLLAELLHCIRRKVWQTRILASRFQQIEPLVASSPDADRRAHNFHMATIRTVWQYLWPSREQMELTQMLKTNRENL